jgi:hypothetical protein
MRHRRLSLGGGPIRGKHKVRKTNATKLANVTTTLISGRLFYSWETTPKAPGHHQVLNDRLQLPVTQAETLYFRLGSRLCENQEILIGMLSSGNHRHP